MNLRISGGCFSEERRGLNTWRYLTTLPPLMRILLISLGITGILSRWVQNHTWLQQTRLANKVGLWAWIPEVCWLQERCASRPILLSFACDDNHINNTELCAPGLLHLLSLGRHLKLGKRRKVFAKNWVTAILVSAHSPGLSFQHLGNCFPPRRCSSICSPSSFVFAN